MIRVSVEVRSGVACFQKTVLAESIERAVRLAATRYPGSDARVLFPIEPEGFFAERPIPEMIQPMERDGAGDHAPAVDRSPLVHHA